MAVEVTAVGKRDHEILGKDPTTTNELTGGYKPTRSGKVCGFRAYLSARGSVLIVILEAVVTNLTRQCSFSRASSDFSGPVN